MKREYWEIVQAMPAAELADLMWRFEALGLYDVWSPQLPATPFATLAAAARKDTAAMLKAIPDEMVTTFAIAGTPDDARERVARMWEYADSMTISAPQYFVPPERMYTYRSAIVETLYKA